MKKPSRYLFVLLVAPLLSGCSGNAKQPKFADYGEKVVWTTFTQKLQDASDESILSKEDKLASVILNSYESSTSTSESRRNERTIEKNVESSIKESVIKYDATNLLFDLNIKSSTNIDGKSSYGKTSIGSNEKRSNMYQSAIIDGKEYVLNVDKVRKEYSSYSVVEEPNTVEIICDQAAKGFALTQYLLFVTNVPSQAEAEAEDTKYSLYVNNKVFTVIYEDSLEEDTLDSDDKVQYTTEQKIEYKFQLDFSDYNWAYRVSKKTSKAITYKMSYSSHVIGDVMIQETTEFVNSTGVSKDINLKPTGLNKYTRVGF